MTSLYAIMSEYQRAIEQTLRDHDAAMRRLGIDRDDTDADDNAMPLAAMLTRQE